LSYNYIGTYTKLHTLKWIKGNDHLTFLEEVRFSYRCSYPTK